MAKVSLRRRPRTPPAARHTTTPAVTAAASRVTDPHKDLKTHIGGGQSWTDKAWEYVAVVGELDYYVRWRSNAASRARLIALTVDPNTGDRTPFEETTPNAALISDLVNQIGGEDQHLILKRLTTFLTVPGEGFVALITDPDTRQESWITLSRKEISKNGATLTFTLPDESKHEYNPDTDMLIRIWDSDPLQAWLPTSPVKANLPVLQEIVDSTRSISNANNSRLIGKGIVVVDDRVNLPAQKAPSAERDGLPAPEPEYADASATDLQDLLYEVATTAYKDDKSMAAMAPIFMTVSGVDAKDALAHFQFDTEVSQTALETRERAIRRLALGLDVSPERLLGLSTSNHWNAWMVTEDDVKLHIVPVLELIAAAITRQVLRPALEALGIPPDGYAVGFDTTNLTQDPDRKQEALAAHQRGAISTDALRRYLGFSDDDGYDLASVEGWQELARDKAAAEIAQLPMLSPLAGPDNAPLPELTPVTRTGGTPSAPELPAESAPGNTVASVVARMCVRRAVELAGKRMLTRENRAKVPHGTVPSDIHKHLPAPQPSEILRLIDGWDTIADPHLLNETGIDRTRLARHVELAAVRVLLRRQ